MATSDHTITLHADTTEFTRDLNRAKRRVQLHAVFVPMLVGAAIVTVGFIVGFVIGVSA